VLGDGTSALHMNWTREIWMKGNNGPDRDLAVSMAWSATVGPVEEDVDGQRMDGL
jgi:hypothetical protein